MSARATTTISLLVAAFFAIVGVVAATSTWQMTKALAEAHAELQSAHDDNQKTKMHAAVAMAEAHRTEEQYRAALDRILVTRLATESEFLKPELANLIELTQRRLDLMTDVARAKWNAKSPIDDPDREETLLAALQTRADDARVNRDLVHTFFRDQIEAAKLIQHERFDAWTAAGEPAFADVPDLKTKLRPKIDKATDDLFLALVNLSPYLETSSPALAERLELQIASRPGANDDSAKALRRALQSILKPPASPDR
jgi:chorismate mutase